MSSQETCEASPSATSSPESADGASPCEWPIGTTGHLFGPAPAHANRSRSPALGAAHRTTGTFGPTCSGSSENADLQSSLASRLKQRFATAGSTLFRLTWKESATPSLRPVCLLRASAHRTSDSGFGSWPTPVKNDSTSTRNATARRSDASRSRHHAGITLVDAASWATPTTRDWKSTASNQHGKNARPLSEQAGLTLNGSPAAMEKPGQLNPRFSGWLMGYPKSWCDCAPINFKRSRRK